MSTDEQALSGLGLASQKTELEALARRYGLELVAIEEDAGLSGSLPAAERPALSRALARLEPGDSLLVAHVDRLGRNVAEGIRLLDDFAARGVVLRSGSVSVEDDSPVTWLLAVILLVIAEFQLRTGRWRTRGALAAKKARGERMGATPFGYRLEGEVLVEDAQEQAAIAFMLERRSAGAGYKLLARELAAAGFRSKRGEWTASGVRSVLATLARKGARPEPHPDPGA